MPETTIRVPGDKSIAHRAVILGCLADGESAVRNVPFAGDVESSIRVMRGLGCEIVRSGDGITIRGRGARALTADGRTLDCGNSGTTARLVMGLAAGLKGAITLDGDASLRGRPMERVAAPLRAAGARIEYLGQAGRLPLRVHGGALHAIRHRPDVASAQVKSALLLAGLVSGVTVEVEERGPTRDHTERMLRRMGAALESDGDRVRFEPGAALDPLDLDVPGDFSSAAFLLTAALLGAQPVHLPTVGVNPTRTGFLDILQCMGASVGRSDESEAGGEPIADLRAEAAQLGAVRVDGSLVVRAIDELPLVAMLAVHARGTTEVRDAADLRRKESDRIHAVCANLRALGVEAEELADGFRVTGTHGPLAGRVPSFGDHRIAMAFATLGARPGSRISVEGAEVADVSYPGFHDALARLARGPSRQPQEERA